MRKINLYKIVSMICGLFLSTVVGAAEVHWEDGARRAWVTEEYKEKPSHDSLFNCLEKLSDDDFNSRHFVKLHYRHIKRLVTTVAEVPRDMEISKGDEVEIKPEKCSEGKLSTIILVLEHKNK